MENKYEFVIDRISIFKHGGKGCGFIPPYYTFLDVIIARLLLM